ncbi:phage tail protein [Pseudoalteromonas sp. Of7M-16]|uniref:phage tail-collar fiber domain-containing protein n=1 Tax=Pseudoalteromonas sp. Of7M-16 TaxID=2917756 RepID=UPI001EF4E3E9|nr:phage tail protein [Pseudoalteromonas sp. Of7M-16]MCG7551574.1 phage tail protein [Pseudoalteromonas sp. Of7M-16]
MSEHIVQFTTAGLAELISAKNTGIKAAITHVAAGDKSYKPLAAQTTLVSERQRVKIADYEELGQTQLRMGAKFTGSLEYEVREIGFYLESGTLLAVYSVPNTLLTYKSRHSSWIQKFTLDISPLPTDSVNVVVGTENINLMVVEEMATSAAAFIKSQATQVKIAHQQMQLNERFRLSGV